MFHRRPDINKLMERQDIQGLIKAFQRASEEARAEIAQILVDMRDPRATEALLRESESADMSIRRIAAQALNRVDPEHKYIAAIHMLNDMHRNVRVSAAGILASLGNPGSLEALIKMLARERDPQARAAAAHAIGTLKDRRGLQPLIDALQDDDERVRISAIKALAHLGDRTALPALMELHENDPHPDGRAAAETAIHDLSRQAS
jgi:HEAT repeat protein